MPGNEGKTGMVAIYDPGNSLDLKGLVGKLKKVLPTYAIPRFIRILSELPMTGNESKFIVDVLCRIVFIML